MRGDLTPEVKLWVFGSSGRLQLPTFGSVGFTLTFIPKWGCDTTPKQEISPESIGEEDLEAQEDHGDPESEEEN